MAILPISSTRSQLLALAYCRVSTADQAEDGASLDAQESMLREQASRRGWDIEVVREEGKSAKSITGRPLLLEALRKLDSNEADVLLAVRLDRVSRSLTDFAGLYDRSGKKGWAIVLPSSGIDTTAAATPSDRFSAQIQAAAAELERGLISARTKEGMAQRRAEGAKFGRPRLIPDDVLARIVDERAAGKSFPKIAATLNAEGIETAHGGLRWYPSTISKALASRAAG
jgi:DNA invertase Pin-like site-specific DNA recombinase